MLDYHFHLSVVHNSLGKGWSTGAEQKYDVRGRSSTASRAKHLV